VLLSIRILDDGYLGIDMHFPISTYHIPTCGIGSVQIYHLAFFESIFAQL
jgi:hypothetical protein